MTRRGWSDLGFGEVAEDTSSMCIGKGLMVPGPPQQERPPDLGSLRAARGQILAAASQRGLRDVRVFGSVARGEAVETSDTRRGLKARIRDRVLAEAVAL